MRPLHIDSRIAVKFLQSGETIVKFRARGFISLLLALAFVVAVVSGSVLFLTPQGRVANWTGWTMAGLSKHEWAALHINACLLMLTAAIIHLVLNWRVFCSYIQKKPVGINLKRELAAALLLTAAVVAGTLYQIPPLTVTLVWGERIKQYWEAESPAAPAAHAEEFTLARLAQTHGLSPEELAAALNEEGIPVGEKDATIAELAKRHGLVPSQVYATVMKRFPQAAASMHASRGGGRGMGMGMGGGRGRAAVDGEAPESSHVPIAAAVDGDPAASEEPGTGGRGMRGGMGMGRGMGGGRGGGWGRRPEEADDAPRESQFPASQLEPTTPE